MRSSKRRPLARFVGGHAVDLVDAHERRVLLGGRGGTRRTLDEVALAQREPSHLRRGHVRVVAAGEVAPGAEEAVALVAQVEEALDVDGFAGELLRSLLEAAVAITVAAPAAAPALVARGLEVGTARLLVLAAR